MLEVTNLCRMWALSTVLVCYCSAQNPVSGYVTTTRGIYRSLDGGGTWHQLSGALPEPGAYSLAIDPSDSNIVYAATVKGVFRSADRGETWSASGFPEGVATVVTNASSPSRLFATGVRASSPANTALWASTDAGVWSPVFVLPGSPAPMWPTVDPADPSTVYVGTRGGVFKSDNGGQTWNPTGAKLDTHWVESAGAGRLFRAGHGGLWTSSDSGDTWSQLNPPESLLRSSYPKDAFLPLAENSDLACGADGRFNCFYVEAVAVDQQTHSSLYACISMQWVSVAGWDWSAAVMKYESGEWSSHPLGSRSGCSSHALATDSMVASSAYLGKVDGLLRTWDGGRNWSEVPEFHGAYVLSIAISPNRSK